MRALTALILPLALSVAAFESEWNPATTWVFAVGVLNFDVPHLRSWPDATRADVELIEALKRRGVPETQIVFLKNSSATKYSVDSQFNSLLSKTKAGDSLIFYYVGHGQRREHEYGKPVNFVPYDSYSRWSVSEIIATIDSRFQGSRAILMADCCYSGALALEAASRKNSRIHYTVLASAYATARSTGNWTYTRLLTDVFKGSPVLDRDGDGAVTVAEAASYSEAEMAICERQMTTSFSMPNGGEKLILSRVSEPKRERAGELCEAKDGTFYSRVKILDAKDGKCFVSWSAFDRPKGETDWIDAAQLRPFAPMTHAKGTRILIQRNQLWFRGSVVDAKFGLHLVHYEGAPDSDDEWVRPDRFRLSE